MRLLLTRLLLMVFVLAMLLVGTSVADSSRKQWVSADGLKKRDECNGFLYRPKRNGVPVYDMPDTSGRVLKKLELGQRVCVVGERQDFVIIEWRVPKEGETPKLDSDKSTLAFARLVDLWPPRDRPTGSGEVGFFRRIKQYLYFMLHGGVPDTPIITPSIPDTGRSSKSSCKKKEKEQTCEY